MTDATNIEPRRPEMPEHFIPYDLALAVDGLRAQEWVRSHSKRSAVAQRRTIIYEFLRATCEGDKSVSGWYCVMATNAQIRDFLLTMPEFASMKPEHLLEVVVKDMRVLCSDDEGAPLMRVSEGRRGNPSVYALRRYPNSPERRCARQKPNAASGQRERPSPADDVGTDLSDLTMREGSPVWTLESAVAAVRCLIPKSVFSYGAGVACGRLPLCRTKRRRVSINQPSTKRSQL